MTRAFFPFLALGLLVETFVPVPLFGKTPEVSIIPERALQFGTFMVFGSGSRLVSASGAISDSSVIALDGTAPAPARFTVRYDRGNENNHVLDIELELAISDSPRTRVDGVEASVSSFETDLPGGAQVSSTKPVRMMIANCRARVCTRSFQVGGRLEVTRSFGGADVEVPIPIDVRIIAVERQR